EVGGLVVDGKDAAAAAMLLQACVDRGLRRVLTFHSTVVRARRFARLLETLAPMYGAQLPSGGVAATSVAGTDPVALRRHRLSLLAAADDRVVVVSNARCLGEGV